MRAAFIFFVLVTWRIPHIHCTTSNCSQAWNGGGTGAWYRVDTSCEFAFLSTRLIHCLPEIFSPSSTDGFYVSLGIFNRLNGVALDIGLTFDVGEKRWFSYGNDARGWKSGSIAIDPQVNRCVNASLSIVDEKIHYRIENESMKLGEDVYSASQIDPSLNLTKNNSQFGFYRFDSIAQTNETLKSGSQMLRARTENWVLELTSTVVVPAEGKFIASNVRGFAPGSCCTTAEMKTISVYEQTPWTEAEISISYR